MKLFLSCLLLALICAHSVLAADLPQRQHVNKGQSFGFNVTSESTNSTTMMGQEHVSSLKATMKSMVSVKEATADSNVFSIDFKNAILSVSGMSFFQIPDTTIHKDDLSAAHEVVVTSQNAKVLRRENALPPPSMDKDQIVLRQLASRNLMRGVFVVFPDQVLKPGLEWTNTTNDTNDQGNGRLISSITMRYTYGGSVDTLGFKCGRIKAKSEKFLVNGTMKQMGHEVNIDGDGIITSNYIFELSTGIPVAIQSNSQSDQRIMVGDGIEIPTSLEIKSSIVRSAK